MAGRPTIPMATGTWPVSSRIFGCLSTMVCLPSHGDTHFADFRDDVIAGLGRRQEGGPHAGPGLFDAVAARQAPVRPSAQLALP